MVKESRNILLLHSGCCTHSVHVFILHVILQDSSGNVQANVELVSQSSSTVKMLQERWTISMSFYSQFIEVYMCQ